MSSGKTIPWRALEVRGKQAAWAAKMPAGTGLDVSVSESEGICSLLFAFLSFGILG